LRIIMNRIVGSPLGCRSLSPSAGSRTRGGEIDRVTETMAWNRDIRDSRDRSGILLSLASLGSLGSLMSLLLFRPPPSAGEPGPGGAGVRGPARGGDRR